MSSPQGEELAPTRRSDESALPFGLEDSAVGTPARTQLLAGVGPPGVAPEGPVPSQLAGAA